MRKINIKITNLKLKIKKCGIVGLSNLIKFFLPFKFSFLISFLEFD